MTYKPLALNFTPHLLPLFVSLLKTQHQINYCLYTMHWFCNWVFQCFHSVIPGKSCHSSTAQHQGDWAMHTATLPCTSSASLHPPFLGFAPPDQLPAVHVCQGQTHLSPKGLTEAQECWKSYAAPRSQPKNTNKSQLHWLLMPLLRLKPGSFHVRLASPHWFIQQMWKLGMEWFSFSEHAVIKMQ